MAVEEFFCFDFCRKRHPGGRTGKRLNVSAASIEALRFESLPEGIRVTVSIGLGRVSGGETNR